MPWNMKMTSQVEAEILIYDVIGYDDLTAKAFVESLKALSPKPESIHLRINTPGGSVIDGNVMYNALLESGAKIRVSIDGMAASMGSILAMAGDRISMAENAWYFIHNPYSWTSGDAAALRNEANLLDGMKKNAIKAYMRHVKGMTEEQVSAMMDEEKWIGAEEALALGFADEITAPRDIEEEMSFAGLKNVPAAVFEKLFGVSSTNAAEPTKYDRFRRENRVLLGKIAGASNWEQVENKSITTQQKGSTMTEQERLAKEAADKARIEAENQAAAENLAKQAAATERKRVLEIQTLCSDLGHPELAVKHIEAGTSFDVAQAEIVKLTVKELRAVRPSGAGVGVSKDEADKIRTGAVNALLVASKVEKSPEKIAEVDASEFKCIRGLQSLVRVFAHRAGMRDVHAYGPSECGQAFLDLLGIGSRSSPQMGLGMNSNDLYSVLSSTAEASLLKGLRETPSTFQAVCAMGTLPDLKSNEMYKMSEAPDVLEIPEGQEPLLSKVSDKYETAKLKKMGRAYSCTEQMIINDRLDIIASLPEKYGRSITREMNYDYWYAVCVTIPTLLETGRPIFNATDGNQAAAGAAISETTLAAGFQAMMTYAMLSPDGGRSKAQRTSLTPRTLCVGPNNALQANKYTSNVYSPDGTTKVMDSNIFGPGGQWRLTPLIEPLIQTLIPATRAWFLALDPSDIDYAKMLTLDGRPAPRTTSRVAGAGEAKGFIFDIEHYWKVALLDWRGYYKNVGV